MKRNYIRPVTAIVLALIVSFSGISDAAKKSTHRNRPRAEKKAEAAVTRADTAAPVELSLPPVDEYVSNSGIQVVYIRDTLPQLTILVSVGFGKLYETANNAGISELLAKTLARGGSKKYPGDALYAAIEAIGGRFSVEPSWEGTTIAMRVLERHAGLAFDILGDIMANPNFDQGFLDEAKSMMREGVRRKKDSPEGLAFEKLREIIFNGEGYGAVTRESTIDSVTLDDVKRVWASHFTEKNIMIGVSSSIDARAVKKYIARAFSGIEEGKRMPYRADGEAFRSAVRKSAGKIYLIPRPIPQATIVVGALAPTVLDGGVYALNVMNYILGEGSFNSRLMREIRVKRGLSYAVQSVIKFRKETGVFMAFAQTKNAQAAVTLSLLRDTINGMAGDTVTDDELRWAKASIAQSYIFEFDTALNMLDKYSFLYYNGLPAAYLTEYQSRIHGVDAASILRESKRLLRDGLVVVVVGGDELKGALAKIGEVVVVNP